MRSHGVPLVYESIYEGAKKIDNPDPKEIEAGRQTLYDTWKFRYPDESNDKIPE